MELILKRELPDRKHRIFKSRNGYGVSVVWNDQCAGYMHGLQDAAIIRFRYADRPDAWDFAKGLKVLPVFHEGLTETEVWGFLRKVGNLRKHRARMVTLDWR